MHHASSGNHHEIASLLIQAGASLFGPNANGRTAMDLAHSTKMSFVFEKKVAEISKASVSSSSTQARRKSSMTYGSGTMGSATTPIMGKRRSTFNHASSPSSSLAQVSYPSPKVALLKMERVLELAHQSTMSMLPRKNLSP